MVDFLPSREVALSFLGIDIRWYGIMYVAGYGLAWWLMPRLQSYKKVFLTSDEWAAVVALGAVGVLLGGRLGYVVFYGLEYFWGHVEEVFYFWMGGMSIHGGIIGVALALWLGGKIFKAGILRLADVAVVPAGLGIALGRLGNLINQEIFVSVEANLLVVLGILVIVGFCFYYLARGRSGDGSVAALFLFMMGVFRFFMEYFRVHDYERLGVFYRGQWLSIVMVGFGIAVGAGSCLMGKKNINNRSLGHETESEGKSREKGNV